MLDFRCRFEGWLYGWFGWSFVEAEKSQVRVNNFGGQPLQACVVLTGRETIMYTLKRYELYTVFFFKSLNCQHDESRNQRSQFCNKLSDLVIFIRKFWQVFFWHQPNVLELRRLYDQSFRLKCEFFFVQQEDFKPFLVNLEN